MMHALILMTIITLFHAWIPMKLPHTFLYVAEGYTHRNRKGLGYIHAY